ncbi:hypothetical protein [Burkholderia sp. AU6039]|uniref:hypothetical protein n=1 Tax=Burkholderia sp. AU6039 TaxID=2015344 RepID=UPI000B7A6794|nr:hypothetical protein [Burkholderia sp. AU6039]OXJ20304.1 hypothetical protein CFB39_10220 [Burkholderia sp. AU6039]
MRSYLDVHVFGGEARFFAVVTAVDDANAAAEVERPAASVVVVQLGLVVAAGRAQCVGEGEGIGRIANSMKVRFMSS